MRFRFIGLATLAAACSGDPSNVAPINPSLIVTQGALDGVTALTVAAYDAATTKCDPKRPGYVLGMPGAAIASLDLGTANCMMGAKYCGNIQIDKGKAKTITFVVTGRSAQKQLATGCSPDFALDQAQSVSIKVYRFLQPPMCGGKLSPYFATQCAAPGNDMDPVCDVECLSKEEYLSSGSMGAGETSDGKNKVRPTFAWISSGDPSEGKFFAFFGDSSQTGRNQVSLRVLAPNMSPCIDGSGNCFPERGLYVQKYSNFMPNDVGGTLPTPGDMNSQTNPAAAVAGGKYFVAFEDGTPPKISVRTILTGLTSEQGSNMQIPLSAGTAQTRPSIATGAGGGKLLVVWQAADGIHGRSLNSMMPSMGLGTEQMYGPGVKPTVAGTTSGFVVAWQEGADVKIRPTDTNGVATAAATKVNDANHMGSQESPAVGSLLDGSVAVVWADTGAPGIFVQRYAPGLMPVVGDQAKRINDAGSMGQPCHSPTIGAGSGADAFYAVAWVNGTNNHVYGRFLDGKGGFLFNPVDGQASEFQASRADSSARANPTVAVGGAGPYVAIGWESAEGGPSALGGPTGGTAIWARRFPIPVK
jgi:hypothetical protein